MELVKEELKAFRIIGDPVADSLIKKWVSKNGVLRLKEIMPLLGDFKHVEKLPEDLGENLLCVSFDDLDKKEIYRACNFFQKNEVSVGLMLSCYALPYCYLGANGAKVLAHTNRIKSDTYNRLKETGQFLSSILNYRNWENEKAQLTLAKVRLLHAAVRYFVLHSKHWDMAWGHPINQEDLAGTNLAFSLIVLRGMHKMGRRIDSAEERAYLYFWQVAGKALGVDPKLLPQNLKEAMHLDKWIAERQFKHSKEGVDLTHALIQTFYNFTNIPLERQFLIGQMHFLLGEHFAKMLEIPKSSIPANLIKSYNYSGSTVFNILN